MNCIVNNKPTIYLRSKVESEPFLTELSKIKCFSHTALIEVGELNGKKAIAFVSKENNIIKICINYMN